MEKIMVANNICDDFLKKLGEIQNMSLAGEKATQGLSQILCKHRNAVQNRAKII